MGSVHFHTPLNCYAHTKHAPQQCTSAYRAHTARNGRIMSASCVVQVVEANFRKLRSDSLHTPLRCHIPVYHIPLKCVRIQKSHSTSRSGIFQRLLLCRWPRLVLKVVRVQFSGQNLALIFAKLALTICTRHHTATQPHQHTAEIPHSYCTQTSAMLHSRKVRSYNFRYRKFFYPFFYTFARAAFELTLFRLPSQNQLKQLPRLFNSSHPALFSLVRTLSLSASFFTPNEEQLFQLFFKVQPWQDGYAPRPSFWPAYPSLCESQWRGRYCGYCYVCDSDGGRGLSFEQTGSTNSRNQKPQILKKN